MGERIFTAGGPSYQEVKDKLFDQFVHPCYENNAGMSGEALEKGFLELAENKGKLTRPELRAGLFCYVAENARVGVDPEDWFANHFDTCSQILVRHRENWRKEYGEGPLHDAEELLRRGKRTGAFEAELDLGHISPGWRFLLHEGVPGIIRRAQDGLDRDGGEEENGFYRSVLRVYGGFLKLMKRLELEADRMAAEHPLHADRMEKLSACLSALEQGPPGTFYEALQLACLFHQLIEFEGEWVRSMGSFELNFGPYYEADIREGRITGEDARELIRFFWMKFFANTRGSGNGKNFYFGGLCADGTDTAGSLSRLALEVYYELNQPDPKLSIKWNSRTGGSFKRLVAKCLRDGRTSMVIINDEEALEAIRKRGVSEADSYDYLLIGCYEPAIEGKEVGCNMCVKFNLAKPVELALFNGTDPMTGEQIGVRTGESRDFSSFEEFYEAYEKQMAKLLSDVQEAVRAYEGCWDQINPEPFLSGTFLPCLEKGRDISRSGPDYNNTGSMGGGLANAADSLLAVKKLVFEEKRYTMDKLKAMLGANFKDCEWERLYLVNRVSKWGNNQEDVDALACRVAKSYTGMVNGVPNGRGGQFTASLFTLDHCFSLGHHTGALPDGRTQGHYIAKGIGAMTGLDKAGVTAQIQSVSKLDFTEIPNGSVLDIYLHPTAVDGEKGIDTLIHLIETYFARGGYGIQFNILNADELRRAQKHPGEYATLQVRVCGWNVYFVTLNEEEQNHFIETTMQVV